MEFTREQLKLINSALDTHHRFMKPEGKPTACRVDCEMCQEAKSAQSLKIAIDMELNGTPDNPIIGSPC